MLLAVDGKPPVMQQDKIIHFLVYPIAVVSFISKYCFCIQSNLVKLIINTISMWSAVVIVTVSDKNISYYSIFRITSLMIKVN